MLASLGGFNQAGQSTTKQGYVSKASLDLNLVHIDKARILTRPHATDKASSESATGGQIKFQDLHHFVVDNFPIFRIDFAVFIQVQHISEISFQLSVINLHVAIVT